MPFPNTMDLARRLAHLWRPPFLTTILRGDERQELATRCKSVRKDLLVSCGLATQSRTRAVRELTEMTKVIGRHGGLTAALAAEAAVVVTRGTLQDAIDGIDYIGAIMLIMDPVIYFVGTMPPAVDMDTRRGLTAAVAHLLRATGALILRLARCNACRVVCETILQVGFGMMMRMCRLVWPTPHPEWGYFVADGPCAPKRMLRYLGDACDAMTIFRESEPLSPTTLGDFANMVQRLCPHLWSLDDTRLHPTQARAIMTHLTWHIHCLMEKIADATELQCMDIFVMAELQRVVARTGRAGAVGTYDLTEAHLLRLARNVRRRDDYVGCHMVVMVAHVLCNQIRAAAASAQSDLEGPGGTTVRVMTGMRSVTDAFAHALAMVPEILAPPDVDDDSRKDLEATRIVLPVVMNSITHATIDCLGMLGVGRPSISTWEHDADCLGILDGLLRASAAFLRIEACGQRLKAEAARARSFATRICIKLAEASTEFVKHAASPAPVEVQEALVRLAETVSKAHHAEVPTHVSRHPIMAVGECVSAHNLVAWDVDDDASNTRAHCVSATLYAMLEKCGAVGSEKDELKTIIDECGDDGVPLTLRTCANLKCRNMLPFAKSKRCTACMRTRYCSKECQLEDWPGHKAACRRWRAAS